MKKKKKHPVLRLRREMPPPTKVYKDRKKQANKMACRKKIDL